MQPATAYKVAKTVSCHCWNRDRTRFPSLLGVTGVEVAVATRNSNDILIYENCSAPRFEDWKLVYTLVGVRFAVYGDG